MHEQTKDPPGTRRIPLTRGMFALVDEANYGWLSKRKWHPRTGPTGIVYAQTSATVAGRRRTIQMHRLVLLGAKLVDHANRNGLDNRIANLRDASKSQNGANAVGKGGRVGHKGVRRHGSGWQARISIDGQLLSLGVYSSPRLAAIAYDAAARLLYREFAFTNFKGENT